MLGLIDPDLMMLYTAQSIAKLDPALETREMQRTIDEPLAPRLNRE